MSDTKRPLWPILAGVLAGSIGALLAALVSLPLRSPDDLIANTASVTLLALLAGILGGIYWRRVYDTTDGRRKLTIAAGIAFAVAVVGLGVLEIVALDRFLSFGVPLAAIILATVALLTPRLSDLELPVWAPLAGVIGALLVGGLLAGVGDAESGDLSLADLPVVSITPTTFVATTVAPTTTAAGTSTAPPSSTPDGALGQFPVSTFTFSGGTATWSVPETFVSTGLDVTAVGRSESLAGTINLAGPSEFTVDLTTFVSDQDRRDSRVRRLFEDDPIATFNTTELTLPEDYTEGEVVATTVTGDLTVNGVTNTVTWSIEARLTGGQLDVTGELDIVLTDYNVEPPSIGGFVSVEDSARLEVLFSATG
ncbi:MAG: hypothetical protein HKN91_11630 [Acidimicrobiia bacterium]|nr:hypothetical protein [Acidimicrobiia bacterium]